MPPSRRLRFLVAFAALLLGACRSETPAPQHSWATLIEPYTAGREVTRGYVLGPPARGPEHDVSFRAVRPGDRTQVEVHVLDRGRWPGVRETRSFGVAWEAPRTTAMRDDAEAVTEALTRAIAAHDPGRGPVDAIPLAATEARRPAWMRALAPLRPLGTWRPTPWWLLALLCAAVAAVGRRPRVQADDAALAAGALAVRVALGAWGPFHINGQGPLWIDGALRPEQLRAYGPGWSELQGPLAHLLAPDRAVFGVNVALSTAIAVLTAAVARRLGLGRGRALVAGALVAGDPVLVRLAATESYVTAVAAFVVASAWAFLAATARDDRRGRVSLGLAGALAAAACARMHPLAYLPLLLVPLVVGAGAGLRAAAACAGAIGAAVALTSGVVLADVATSVAHGTTAPPSWVASSTSIALLVALVTVSLHPRVRHLAPALLASAAIGVVVASTYSQSDVWRQAALRVVALPAVLTLAALVPEVAVTAPRRAGALALALAFAALVAGHRVVRYTTTDAAEYAWASRVLRTIPAGCRVAWVAFAGPRRTVFLPTWAHRGEAAPLDARGPVNVRASLEPLGCTWYVRTTACDTDDGGPACAAVERDLNLVPVTATRFAARLSHGALPYPRVTVRAALFRVNALRPEGRP